MSSAAAPLDSLVPSPCEISDDEKRQLLEIAAASLRSRLAGGSPSDSFAATAALERRSGAFVSIYHGAALRGCVGVVEPRQPLWIAVRDMTVAAASQDPRFAPIGAEEWSALAIEISVLGLLVPVPLERRAADGNFVLVGEHGVCVRLQRRTGLLLPQVATKFGWSALEFLHQACRKADLDSDAWRTPQASLSLFRTLQIRAELEMYG